MEEPPSLFSAIFTSLISVVTLVVRLVLVRLPVTLYSALSTVIGPIARAPLAALRAIFAVPLMLISPFEEIIVFALFAIVAGALVALCALLALRLIAAILLEPQQQSREPLARSKPSSAPVMARKISGASRRSTVSVTQKDDKGKARATEQAPPMRLSSSKERRRRRLSVLRHVLQDEGYEDEYVSADEDEAVKVKREGHDSDSSPDPQGWREVFDSEYETDATI